VPEQRQLRTDRTQHQRRRLLSVSQYRTFKCPSHVGYGVRRRLYLPVNVAIARARMLFIVVARAETKRAN
jgi:hypothetical protein